MKKILRILRTKGNFSQSAVADYLEISRQMYNKYETGNAEPSLKNIKKLCELYKVSPDVFFKNDEDIPVDSAEYKIEDNDGSVVASPTIPYGTSPKQTKTTDTLFSELLNQIPLLQLNEQISLMSKLAAIIEKQTCSTTATSLKTKKIKKIPDTEYKNLINLNESQMFRTSSLSTVREILKNDEW